jgi:cytochrome c-type biogenesis protein CcmH/NrfG
VWREVLADAPADASWRPLVEDAVAAVQAPPARR